MKKTLFSTMLAAALMSCGSIFAGTVVTGHDTANSSPPDYVYGRYDKSHAVGGYVTIGYDEASGWEQLNSVYGGYAGRNQASLASDNTVFMSDGKVAAIVGGMATAIDSTVSGNLVIVAGGTVVRVYGGLVVEPARAKNNTVAVTGGSIGAVYAGNTSGLSDYNSVEIVGTGASYSHQSRTIAGSAISIGSVAASRTIASVLVDNALNISGTDIQIGTVGTDFQILNFHLLADQLASTAPMVTITGTNGFSITKDLALSFDAVEGMIWKPGDSVTLVEAQKGMNIAQEVLAKEYNIYQNGDPEKILATAKLVLEDSQNSTQFLKLTFQGVPEPTTGILGLLALAALAARRRKK